MGKFITVLSLMFISLIGPTGLASPYSLPEIPATLKDIGARADYLARHYWDNFDSGKDAEDSEQVFVDFLSILPVTTNDSVRVEAFSLLLNGTASRPELFNRFRGWAESYLNNYDSPMKSDSLFIDYLTALSRCELLDEAETARVADRLEMALKNRVGHKAADFTFRNLEGVESSLYELLPMDENRKVLLIFFDPECETCEEVISELTASKELEGKLAEGKYAVLAVYAGENEAAWRAKAQGMPASWTVGINDGTIEDEDIYYLPEMPTVYLLDGNGTVLEKELSKKFLFNAIQ